MSAAETKVAALDAAQLAKLQSLGKRMGVCQVAVEATPRLARLDDEQLRRLRRAEQDLGVVLLAYAGH